MIGNLNNKTIFITGATGLIGKAVVRYIIKNYPTATVIACVRNEQKAKKIFSDIESRITIYVSDVKKIVPVDMGVDYVIHCASITNSKAFVEMPVDVINESIIGTENVLKFAVVNNIKGFVFLSTMETYGFSDEERKICEDAPSYLDTMNVRSCYPISKRLCENMCVAYCSQYGLPINVLRLTQTFGNGVDYNDTRVFAEFARCVIENKDIVLKTKGETKRCYLDVDDAVTAILTVLTNGTSGQAYNVANESTYCSIYEMAKLVASLNSKISVKIEVGNSTANGYAPTLKSNLSCAKLNKLGWKAEFGLRETFVKMINDMGGNVV